MIPSGRPLSALAAPWTPASLTDTQHPSGGDFPAILSSAPHRTASESPLDSPMNHEVPVFPPPVRPAAHLATNALMSGSPPATATTWKSTSVRFGAPSLPWRAPPTGSGAKPIPAPAAALSRSPQSHSAGLGNSPEQQVVSESRTSARGSRQGSFSREVSVENAMGQGPWSSNAGFSGSPLPVGPGADASNTGSNSAATAAPREGDLTPSKLEKLARLYGIPPVRKSNSSPSNASSQSSNRDYSSSANRIVWPSERSPMVAAAHTPKHHASRVASAPAGPFRGVLSSHQQLQLPASMMPGSSSHTPVRVGVASGAAASLATEERSGGAATVTAIPRRSANGSDSSPIGRANGVGASLTNRPGVSFAASSVGDGDSIIQHVMVPDYLDEDGMGEYVMCAGGGYFDVATGVFMRPAYEMDADEVGSQFSFGGHSTARDEVAWRQRHHDPNAAAAGAQEADEMNFDDYDDDVDEDCRGSSLNSDEQQWLEEQLQGVTAPPPAQLFF